MARKQINLLQFCCSPCTKWMEHARISAIINPDWRAAAEEVSNVRTNAPDAGAMLGEFVAWALGQLLGCCITEATLVLGSGPFPLSPDGGVRNRSHRVVGG